MSQLESSGDDSLAVPGPGAMEIYSGIAGHFSIILDGRCFFDELMPGLAIGHLSTLTAPRELSELLHAISEYT